MIANAAQLLLANACLLAAGVGVTGLCGWWGGARGAMRSLGVSYLAGLASFGVIAQIGYVLGASLALWQVVVICAVLAAGASAAVRAPARPTLPLAIPLPAALAGVAMLLLLAVDLWYQPLWAFDAWTFWTPKAHALFEMNGLDARWFGAQDLRNVDYPLLLPAVESATFRFTGYETSLLDLQSWLALVAFCAATVEVVSRLGGRRSVLYGALLTVVFAPSVADQLAGAEADLPLAALFACAGLCAAAWLEDGRLGTLALAAVLSAGVAATKIEGTAFTVALFAALAVVAGRRRALLPSLAGIAALAVGILPWRIWLSEHHVREQVTVHRLTSPSLLGGHVLRVPHAIAYLAWRLVDPRAWLLLLPLVLGVLWTARRSWTPLASFAVVGALLALAGLVVAYWTTPLPFHYHLATSGRRVITGPLFFLAALAPLAVRDVRERRRYPADP
jgi:hypothetical protein